MFEAIFRRKKEKMPLIINMRTNMKYRINTYNLKVSLKMLFKNYFKNALLNDFKYIRYINFLKFIAVIAFLYFCSVSDGETGKNIF